MPLHAQLPALRTANPRRTPLLGDGAVGICNDLQAWEGRRQGTSKLPGDGAALPQLPIVTASCKVGSEPAGGSWAATPCFTLVVPPTALLQLIHDLTGYSIFLPSPSEPSMSFTHCEFKQCVEGSGVGRGDGRGAALGGEWWQPCCILGAHGSACCRAALGSWLHGTTHNTAPMYTPPTCLCDSRSLQDSATSCTLRFLNSSCSLAAAPSSLVHTWAGGSDGQTEQDGWAWTHVQQGGQQQIGWHAPAQGRRAAGASTGKSGRLKC